MSNVQVKEKELGNGLRAILVAIDGEEGMTFPEVVRVLGIPKATISEYCGKHRLAFVRFSEQTRRTLREAGVIPLRGAPPSFVPHSIIKELVRFYSNPQTDAIYNQLWDLAEAVQRKELFQATVELGFSLDEMKQLHINYGDELTKLQAEIDRKNRLLENQAKNASTFCDQFGMGSLEISREWPNVYQQCIKWLQWNQPKGWEYALQKMKHGVISRYLKLEHKIEPNIYRKRAEDLEAGLVFDREVVEKVFKGLKWI